MFVKKSYKFRVHPTKKQIVALQQTLDECRFLYNLYLEQRILAYQELDMRLTKYDQLMMLPLLKEDRPSLRCVHSQVLQDIVIRLDKSFEAFFKRCAAGEKPGFPRFRSKNRFDSFTYPQSGFCLVDTALRLSKLGTIRIQKHREIRGKIKTCTLCRSACGAWYVCLSCEEEARPLSENERAVGIDMGVENWAYLSDGTIIQNPRFFKQEQKALAKASRKLSSLELKTPQRHKQKKVVAKIHERIRNKRSDFCHKASRRIVNEYQYICVEELDIQKMLEGSPLGHCMARNIADASWDQFCRFLSYKAEDAGRKIGFVKPAYTSQDCSKCGFREKKKLSQRTHQCSNCGYTAHRDLNSAENILALGLDGLGVCPRSLRL